MELFYFTNMGLQEKDRIVLQNMINEEIIKIPALVRNLRLPEFKDVFQIKDEAEYVYGYTHGSISGKFETYYFVVHSSKKPSGKEADEIAKTLLESSSRIREAIFKTG
jgi:hypothetical protein